MAKFVPALVASVIALLVGYFMGRSNELPAQRPTSLYIADVSVVDAETGLPLNAALHYPENFFGSILLSESESSKQPGIGGPIRTEQDSKTGRCRIIWCGTPATEFRFRFSIDGYKTMELPPRFVKEIAHSENGGILGPSLLPMEKLEHPKENKSVTLPGTRHD